MVSELRRYNCILILVSNTEMALTQVKLFRDNDLVYHEKNTDTKNERLGNRRDDKPSARLTYTED